MIRLFNKSTLAGCLLLLSCAFALAQSSSETHLTYPHPQDLTLQVHQRLTQKLPMQALYKELQAQSYANNDERQAMHFLYAYMELADMVNLPVNFFLNNVRSSLQARREMPWGLQVPQELFMHYVLPVRINNEFLDEARIPFFQELKERVRGMSMTQAAIEVNHWCHEYVTYAPSDARTLSPLATQRNALGRCGEESTFTVAAMRAVGIPARQVYTPRWAHTDDNHAWVEVWVDGAWAFLGACEPAAELNLAWFNSSVLRAMLVHTRVFGRLGADTKEEVVTRSDSFTEVNSIATYTQTKQLKVRVLDVAGKPVDGATVRYCLYNYAEFYPVVTQQTDGRGMCTPLRTGKGDMLIWAFKDGFSGGAIARAENGEELVLTLRPYGDWTLPEEFRIVPPKALPFVSPLTPEQEADNQLRWTKEDAIRSSYESSFFSLAKATEAVAALNIPSEDASKRLVGYLQTARGNHDTILSFVRSVPANRRSAAVDLLSVLSSKDLTDVALPVLQGVFAALPDKPMDSFTLTYVANPRIENEHLSVYREQLRAAIPARLRADIQRKPVLLLEWMQNNFKRYDRENPRRLSILPEASLRYRTYDLRGAKIFFVAMARSLDIPARINPVTGDVEYTSGAEQPWIKVDFQQSKASTPPMGALRLHYTPTKELPLPKYYSNFSLARLTPEGGLNTLYYDENEDCSYTALFGSPRPLEVGTYILTSGTRMANGMVIGHTSTVKIEEGKTTTVDLLFPKDEHEVAVIGTINAEENYWPEPNSEATTLLSTTGRGYFVLALLKPGTEPTNHALKDLEKVASELNEWGRPFLFLFESEADMKRFDRSNFPNLPKQCHWGIDKNRKIQSMLREAASLSQSRELPLVVVADSFGRVVFAREGYTIGLGEQILRILPKL